MAEPIAITGIALGAMFLRLFWPAMRIVLKRLRSRLAKASGHHCDDCASDPGFHTNDPAMWTERRLRP